MHEQLHDRAAPAVAPAAEAAPSSERLPRRAATGAATGGVRSAATSAFGDAVSAGIHGERLPSQLAGTFEASLGTDLGDVRVHTGGESQAAARSMSARAFATGQDIHFGAGQYDPASKDGQKLIAHEVAHTVQQRGTTTAPQTKLEVTKAGDACETEADRAADAMVEGAPATVSSQPAAIARWGEGEMDASARADASAEPAPVDPATVTSGLSGVTSRNWMTDAQTTMAGLAEDGNLLLAQPAQFGPVPAALADDPSLSTGWSTLVDGATASSQAWADLAPRLSTYLSMPTDFAIAGGGGLRMHDATSADGAHVPVSPATRTRAFEDPTFQAAAANLRAMEHALTAAHHEASAAGSEVRAAQSDVVHAMQMREVTRAGERREGAERTRATAVEGRAAELARIQNYIRVAEVGIGILAGGVGAYAAGASAVAAAAPGATVAAPTIAGSARTAVGSTVAGIGSNGLHDLAVGALAEAFLSGHWDAQIADADRAITREARAARTAANAAQAAAIDAATARQEAARSNLSAATERLRQAQSAYRQATLQLAGSAGRDVGGPDGRRMQGALAALAPIQQRLALLAQLRGLAEVPAYTDASGWAFGYASHHEVGPVEATRQFVQLVARLLYIRDRLLPRELAHWQTREHAVSGMLGEIAPDTAAP